MADEPKTREKLIEAVNYETVGELAGALSLALTVTLRHLQIDHNRAIRPIDIMAGITCFVDNSMGKIFEHTPAAGEREQKMIRGTMVEMIHTAMFVEQGKENLKKWN